MLKTVLKFLASRVDPSVFERAVAYGHLRRAEPLLARAQRLGSREEVWDQAIRTVGANTLITYLEFGVYKGYSIKYFSQRFDNSSSQFVGFDSFEGLPEDWTSFEKGTFSTDGASPQLADARVSFVNGWFQDSLPDFLRKHEAAMSSEIIIHFDADLYSSTLFLLTSLWHYLPRYHFCFDEFMGDELRALTDFSRSHPATISFLAYDVENGFPARVFGKFERRSLVSGDQSRSRSG